MIGIIIGMCFSSIGLLIALCALDRRLNIAEANIKFLQSDFRHLNARMLYLRSKLTNAQHGE